MAGFGACVFVVITVLFLLVQAKYLAPVVGIVVAAVWIAIAALRADNVVLDLSEVEPASEKDHARLFNVVAGLCSTMGVPAPALYIVEDPALNAMATGRDDHHGSLVFTTGAIEQLSVVELEALSALLLYRLKAGDVGAQTIVVPTVGISAVLAEVADKWDWLRRILLVPMPLIQRTMIKLHPAREELETDVAAVQFTRYPPALATALEKMDGHSVLAMGSLVTAHLWAAPPLSVAARPPNAALVHAPLRERIAVLQEL